MSYNDDNYWITYNGEVYNYIEIRVELEKEGFTFCSHSDTEVILAAYQKWGTDCVKKFNGMWAFAIWDRNKDHFFLSRDRVGIKPLYYYQRNGEFIFSSEIKGIRTYLNNKLTLSEKKIYEYLIRGQIFVGESNETIYEEVKQLIPGSNLIFKQDKLDIDKYWSLKLTGNKLSINENVDKFKELFHQSIKYRLRSDVEVGSCLSGGLDSSSLVSFASKKFGKKFHTFSAIWPGNSCDESYFVDKVNKKWHCHPNAFTPRLENLLEIIDKEIWHQEIPLAGSSLLAQWFVMERAQKNGIKVLLDGQGADEILSGYPVYLIPYINEMIYSFQWHQLYKYYPSLKKNGYPIKRFIGIQKHKLFSHRKPAFPIKKVRINKYEFKTMYSIPHKCNYLPQFLKDQIEKTNLPCLLHFEDRNSMAHSVEARVPFLDHELVEFALSIPTAQKIHGALTKIILRESMKNYLPVEIYNRTDKIGFSSPIEQNLFYKDSKFYALGMEYIRKSELNQMDLLDNNSIDGDNIFGIYTLAKFVDMWN